MILETSNSECYWWLQLRSWWRPCTMWKRRQGQQHQTPAIATLLWICVHFCYWAKHRIIILGALVDSVDGNYSDLGDLLSDTTVTGIGYCLNFGEYRYGQTWGNRLWTVPCALWCTSARSYWGQLPSCVCGVWEWIQLARSGELLNLLCLFLSSFPSWLFSNWPNS